MPGIKMTSTIVEKPWGRTDVPERFGGTPSSKIGEVWFDAPERPGLPLLVKYIFTSEKLSIQVHPNDAEAAERGLSGGKSECWYILDAGPDATLGIGTKQPLDEAALRAAALDGSLEALMDWKQVRAGDFFYIPAGTVHAIGPDVTLVEVQQNNDVTYRLYDYGRPRELHLDDGVSVSKAKPYSLPHHTIALGESKRLLRGDEALFSLDMICWAPGEAVAIPSARAWFVPVTGAGTLDGAPWQGSECWLLEDHPVVAVEQPTTGFIAWAA